MPPKFVVGDRVQTNAVPVYVRSQADKNSALVVKLETAPMQGFITDGPVSAQYVYYQVSFEYLPGQFHWGWVDEARLDKVEVLTPRQRAEAKLQAPTWTPLTAEEAGSL